MSMTAKFYTNFSKRKNSTKQPNGGTTVNIVIKQGCSVENPVFLIDGVDLNVNYIQWNGAYYFVDDITLSKNNIYEISCSMDSLATFKSAIGGSTQFVERSASAYDPLVPDNLLSSSLDIVAQSSNVTTLSDLSTSGCYLINTFSYNGVTVYGYNDLSDLVGLLNNNALGIDNNALQALITTIGANLFDISAYVSNIRWIPVDLSDLTGTDNYPVAVSFYPVTGFTAKKITQKQLTFSGNVVKPNNEYSDFRAYDDRFSRYSIRLPAIGVIYLPAIYFADDIYYIGTFDILSGKISYTLYSQYEDENHITHQSFIGKYCGQMGVEIPYSSSRIDVGQIIQSMLPPTQMSGGIGMAGKIGSSGNIISSAVQTAAEYVQNGVIGVTDAIINHPYSINSSAGNISDIRNGTDIVVSVTNFATKDYLTSVAGRPLHESRQINTLSGYIKCSNPSLEIAGTSREKDKVNAYLANGFYYE